jgi:hypothetical protein
MFKQVHAKQKFAVLTIKLSFFILCLLVLHLSHFQHFFEHFIFVDMCKKVRIIGVALSCNMIIMKMGQRMLARFSS